MNKSKTNISLFFFMGLVIFSGSLYGNQSHAETTDDNTVDKYVLELKEQTFTPEPELSLDFLYEQSVDENDQIFFLMQFQEIPNAAVKESLSSQGITLLDYIGGNTYIVSVSSSNVSSMAENMSSDIRSAFALDPNMKISSEIKDGNIGEWAIPNTIASDAVSTSADLISEKMAVLTVHFHKNVNMDDAVSIIEKHDGVTLDTIPIISAVTTIMKLDDGSIYRLAEENKVQFIGVVDPPLEPTNDGARVAANVQPLVQTPYDLSGDGVTALVYDEGIIDTAHPDFGNRIIETEPNTTVSAHATHVAGTFGGDGINSNGNDSNGNPNEGSPNQWAGMAPQAEIRSFKGTGGNFDSQIQGDFTTAINNGVDLTTMSLSVSASQNGIIFCNILGDYTSTSILIDSIVTGEINNQQLIFFESAGNNRTLWQDNNGNRIVDPGEIISGLCGDFGTIGSPATAKNSIAVGATNSNDNTITEFSSFGPTDDGRIKPDITAPGCQSDGDSTIKSTGTNNDYRPSCGTSMATPVASGSGALLIEQWRKSFDTDPLPAPHTIKAILVHTSDDLGNVGPDYQFGWGMLNAKNAIDLVKAYKDSASTIKTDSIEQGKSPNIYRFDSDGTDEVKVTLVWDDSPASRLSTQTLINDLDLVLIDPNGTKHHPFVLDSTNPSFQADTGIDKINNVEMVVSESIQGTWQVQVGGTNIPQGPQEYTLIISEPLNCEPPSTGDWTIASSCTMKSSVTISNGSVIVKNNSVLTIPNGITLDVDLVNNNLQVQQGSGILVQSGGTIR